MSRGRRLAGDLLLAAFSLGVVLLALELGARASVEWGVRKAQAAPPVKKISRYHPVLGWDKPPGGESQIDRPEFHITIRINSKGLRGPERDYPKPAGTRRVLILGDSFAEGYYVEEDDSVRAALEALLNGEGCRSEVVNGATIAYSTDQEYLFFREEGAKYQPDLVLLLFFYNDLYYNASSLGPGGEDKPYFDLDGEELVLRNHPVPQPTRGVLNRTEPGPQRIRPWRGSIALRMLSNRTVNSSPRLHDALARLGLVEPVPLDPPREYWPYGPGHGPEVSAMWKRTRAILRALQRDVEAKGARLALFYVPQRFEVNDAVWELTRERYRLGRRWDRFVVFDKLKAVTDELGLALVDPREALRRAEAGARPAYYTRDVHWTEVGNAVAAHELLPLTRRLLGCGS